MRNLLQDLRYAFRLFGRNPGLTAVAVLSLAIGIGPNSALFSIVTATILRPFPAKDAEQIVSLSIKTDKGYEGVSYPDYLDFRDQNSVLSGLAAWQKRGALLTTEGGQEVVARQVVSENYFSVLGIEPALGRLFLPSRDEHVEGEPSVVISHGVWQRRFGADPGLVGRTILLTGKGHTVIGVAARGFGGLGPLTPADVWVPFSALDSKERASLSQRDKGFGLVFGRLRTGVSKEQAEVELNGIAARLAEAYPVTNKGRRVVLTAEAADRGRSGITLSVIVMSLVSLVLLIACANVAGLLLAQAETRRRETAIRLAMGARRGRLVRQFLTECALLSLMGAAVGLLVAMWLLDVVPALKPPALFMFSYDFEINGRVLGYTLVLSLMTAFFFGLVPALRASRPDVIPELKGESRLGSGRRRFIGRSMLVVAQIAVAQLLLTGAGLLLRSYFNTRQIHPGFDTKRNLLLVSVIPLPDGERQDVRVDYGELLGRIQAIPGVKRASLARRLPLSGSGGGAMVSVSIPGAVLPSGEETTDVRYNVVGLGYFSTMGTRIVRGSDFERRDGREGSRVVLINETMARRFWPSVERADAVGKWLRIEGTDHRIVGTVEDGKYVRLHEAPQPYLFLPSPMRLGGDAQLVVETAVPPRAVANGVRQAVSGTERNLKIVRLNTLKEHLRSSHMLEELAASLTGTIGLLGMFLASVGLYGLVSHAVNRRRQEIGIRMAMGAQRRDVLRLVLGQGLRLSLIGASIGLAAALAAGRVMERFLYGVSGTDPATFAVSALTVVAITLLASHLPARRAVKMDLVTALRYE